MEKELKMKKNHIIKNIDTFEFKYICFLKFFNFVKFLSN